MVVGKETVKETFMTEARRDMSRFRVAAEVAAAEGNENENENEGGAEGEA